MLQIDSSKNGAYKYLWRNNLYNIISFGKKKENLLLAIHNQTIGSYLATFKDNVENGAVIFLHCKGKIWATGQISSVYYFSDEPIWQDKTYPHRFNFQIRKILESPVTINDGTINVLLKKSYGVGWAFRFIFTPRPIPQNIAELILEKCNAVKESSIDQFEKMLSEN